MLLLVLVIVNFCYDKISVSFCIESSCHEFLLASFVGGLVYVLLLATVSERFFRKVSALMIM